MTPTPPIDTDIVLVGGGHAHVEVLRRFAMDPVPGARLTVVARDVLTPYSGMLPGYLAGLYTHREAHVDLRPLAARAGARLIHGTACGLDAAARTLAIEGRPPLRYDLCSLDIGSTPATSAIEGAEHAIAVKPVDRFLQRWEAVEDRALASGGPFRVVVVGGGAGGVEVCLGLFHRLSARLAAAGDDPSRLAFGLVTDSDVLLPRHGPAVRRRMVEAFRREGVALHIAHRVTRIEADAVRCDDGLVLPAEVAVLVTTAGAPSWLRSTGLALDDGFVRVDATLRSLSHPDVLAAGDVAAFEPGPLAKNGVYAVRQGPRLADNLRRLALGLGPRPFRPSGRRSPSSPPGSATPSLPAARWRWRATGSGAGRMPSTAAGWRRTARSFPPCLPWRRRPCAAAAAAPRCLP